MIKGWLTYSSLTVSRTAVLMKNEKSVRGRATQACHCQSQCVLRSQATWSSLRRPRERETDRERQWRGEGRQLWRKVKWCGHSPSPGKPTPLSKKKTQPMTNTGNCVHAESHDCQNTTPSLHTETRSRKKQDRKRGKTETRSTDIIEFFRKTQLDQQFKPLHEGGKYSSLPTILSFLAAVVARQVVRLFLKLTHLNTI